MPDGLARAPSVADQGVAVDIRLAPQRAVRLREFRFDKSGAACRGARCFGPRSGALPPD